MKKRLIVRSLIGLAVGSLLAHVITILIIYFSRGEYLFCMPELTEKLGSVGAVALQTVLGAIFGMVAFGGMCFSTSKNGACCAPQCTLLDDTRYVYRCRSAFALASFQDRTNTVHGEASLSLFTL